MDESLMDRLKALGVHLGGQGLPAPKPYASCAMEDILDGDVVANPLGECFVVRKTYPSDFLHGELTLDVLPKMPYLSGFSHLSNLADTSSDQLIFLDTETTGLLPAAGTFPFLIGLCWPSRAGAEVALLMARSPAEEAATLYEMVQIIGGCVAVVTYNGKTFDIPLLESRLSLQGIRSPFRNLGHIDLLQIARRLWKNTLPSRRLGSIETSILGVSRKREEVPGYLIPQVYYDYLRSGDARPLVGVLYHNEMDILSLIALLNYIELHATENLASLNPSDLLAVAETLLHSQDTRSLDTLLPEILGLEKESVRWSSLRKLADWYKKNRNWPPALQLYQKAADADQLWGQLELAKYYEYQPKNYPCAIYWSTRMLATIRQMRLAPFSEKMQQDEIQKRIQRLEKKSARGEQA